MIQPFLLADAWLPMIVFFIIVVLAGSGKREVKRKQERWQGAAERQQFPEDTPKAPAEAAAWPSSIDASYSSLADQGPGHAGEGADPCHDGWTAQPVSMGHATAPIPGLRLGFTADELVRGVVYAEILARPMARRR